MKNSKYFNMFRTEKGIAHLVIIIVTAAVLAGAAGYWFYKNYSSDLSESRASGTVPLKITKVSFVSAHPAVIYAKSYTGRLLFMGFDAFEGTKIRFEIQVKKIGNPSVLKDLAVKYRQQSFGKNGWTSKTVVQNNAIPTSSMTGQSQSFYLDYTVPSLGTNYYSFNSLVFYYGSVNNSEFLGLIYGFSASINNQSFLPYIINLPSPQIGDAITVDVSVYKYGGKGSGGAQIKLYMGNTVVATQPTGPMFTYPRKGYPFSFSADYIGGRIKVCVGQDLPVPRSVNPTGYLNCDYADAHGIDIFKDLNP